MRHVQELLGLTSYLSENLGSLRVTFMHMPLLDLHLFPDDVINFTIHQVRIDGCVLCCCSKATEWSTVPPRTPSPTPRKGLRSSTTKGGDGHPQLWQISWTCSVSRTCFYKGIELFYQGIGSVFLYTWCRMFPLAFCLFLVKHVLSNIVTTSVDSGLGAGFDAGFR